MLEDLGLRQYAITGQVVEPAEIRFSTQAPSVVFPTEVECGE